jgi:hypothetical protein
MNHPELNEKQNLNLARLPIPPRGLYQFTLMPVILA